MIRGDARKRREFIYRKALEEKQRALEEKRRLVSEAIENNRKIPTELRKDALELQKGATMSIDDEYRWAGTRDPRIVITTSREPSAKLKMFVKEMKHVFPNAQRINRGHYDVKQLVQACRTNDVTDFIVLHETRGQPDSMVVCHLPFGPTAHFTISNVVMRHDIPESEREHISEQYPHLIFHNMKSKVGLRITSILKYLFPVPKPDSRRVITFANDDDFIAFRQHTFKTVKGGEVELKEIGPRFQLRPFSIKLGTLENLEAADVEWQLTSFLRTANKRQVLAGQVSEKEDEE